MRLCCHDAWMQPYRVHAPRMDGMMQQQSNGELLTDKVGESRQQWTWGLEAPCCPLWVRFVLWTQYEVKPMWYTSTYHSTAFLHLSFLSLHSCIVYNQLSAGYIYSCILTHWIKPFWRILQLWVWYLCSVYTYIHITHPRISKSFRNEPWHIH